ncbi:MULTISPECIES: GTPase HflX [Leeia]|uniref:GTPase HflX n=1 Tax=Leeia aquatica TaxID=2725557 RepID=A0A847SDZ2_9NEIS|nr:GTPase HflX [Leeia aquatica]NLR75398.1 GTPase HflX [Leeia aquatica]
MFDRPDAGDRAVLVALDFGDPDFLESFAELRELARSAGIDTLHEVTGRRDRPDPALFAGSGKVEEIATVARAVEASVVIFNHQLSPAQERNLERALQCRVIDRTSLILDIFAQRAQSFEGKLQVELAQLDHLSTRLVRGWTHLERQKGGIGLRGPGETQLETDRRLIGKRVKLLRERLAKAQKQRSVQRRSRHRGGVFSVSIVGYTNAGKSTLFNRLTNARAYAADQLFATLDTTSRKVFLGENESVVLSDTVGFIRQLPHSLVAAFRATLEETVHADLLLHVVDSSHPLRDQHIIEVNKVLREIGAEQIPQILVFNKVDLRPGQLAGVERDDYGKISAVRVSALTGAGLDALREVLREVQVGSVEVAMPDAVGPDWSPLDG